MKLTGFAFFVTASILLAAPVGGEAGQGNAVAADGSGTASKVGSAIGTTLKTALTTAFPVVGTILDAIWPQGQENKGKNKTTATNATQNLQNKSNEGLQKLAGLSAGLDAVAAFLSACVTAEDNVASLRGFLVGKTGSLNDGDQLQAGRYWNPAKGNIASLKATAATINNVGDPAVQIVFRAVADANSGLIANIDAELKSKASNALDLLRQDLATLDTQLAAVNGLSGEIIQDISMALKATKNTAAGAAGGGTLTPAQQTSRKAFNSILSKRYPSLNNGN